MPHSYDAYAKFNLYLAVLGKRPDGYHEIDTILQSVSLADRLVCEPLDEPTLEVIADAADVPSGRENLVWQALDLLRRTCGTERGMRVAIHKRIPSRAGLGGGSSDAACALCAANRLWDLALEADNLEQLAAQLGSDVPFFVRGGTQRGRGRGEQLSPIAALPESEWVIVKPEKDLATAMVYRRATAYLTHRSCISRILLGALAKRELPSIVAHTGNDLERAAVELQPEGASVKAWMGQLGLRGIVLAGSGSSWVGQCPDPRLSPQALAEGRARGWKVFLVKPTRRGWSEAKNGIQ